MSYNPYGAYLESRVLSATPLELVQLAYEGTITAVQDAREHLAAGRIQERSTAITKAVAILQELATSLNYEVGGDLSLQLARLYDYMQVRLLDANAKQIDEPLQDVERLLHTLYEAWSEIGNTAPRIPPATVEPWAMADRYDITAPAALHL